MKILNSIFFVLFALGLASCQTEPTYRIFGVWEKGDGQLVRLVEGWGENPDRTLDSAFVVDGKYELKAPLGQSGRRAFLKLGEKYYMPVFLNEEPIEASVGAVPDDTSFRFRTIGGEEQKVMEKAGELIAFRGFAMMFGADLEGPEEMFESFIDTNRNREAIAYFMDDLLDSKYSLPTIEKDYANLAPEVKASVAGQALLQRIEFMKPTAMGGIAPDIQLADTTGKTISLYSLRGNYVLLDFWASWCSPCREEIPNLKEIYAAYHDKGLEIYSVSLDSKREAWTKALNELEMPWVHVSSLKGWDCPTAKRYGVTSIPKMYLLDPQGKIIGIDLRGETLKEKIAFLNENL